MSKKDFEYKKQLKLLENKKWIIIDKFVDKNYKRVLILSCIILLAIGIWRLFE